LLGVATPCKSRGARVLGGLRGRAGRSSPDGAAFVIFNAKDAFVHPSQLRWPEVYVPEPVVDFFQPDVLAGQRMRHADPVLLPPDAAVATDEADFEVAGWSRLKAATASSIIRGRSGELRLRENQATISRLATLNSILKQAGLKK
jgi:hypothetical protein